MTVFEIYRSSLPDGAFAAAWFDDEQALWEDDRLDKAPSLATEWSAPALRLLRPERGVTDVLHNPNALAVSARVGEELRRFPEIELLPIAIDGHGTFFVMHVTTAVEASADFRVQRVPVPGGNIVVLEEFPEGFVPPAAFFRVRQPRDSAAGAGGYCLSTIYATEAGARAIEAACSPYLSARVVRRDP